MLKTSAQKQRKYPSPTFHTFSATCAILNAGFLINARSKISAKPLSCLRLDISNYIISILADSTHLLPLVSELLTLNSINATKKADEMRTNKAACSEKSRELLNWRNNSPLLSCYHLSKPTHKKKEILPMMFLLSKWEESSERHWYTDPRNYVPSEAVHTFHSFLPCLTAT